MIAHRYTIAFFAAITALFSHAQDMTRAYDVATQQVYTTTDHEAINRYNIIKDTEIVYYGRDDRTIDSAAYISMLNRFYDDYFRHPQDPKAPYFMLMSRSGNMAMGVGGDLRLIGSYDFDGSMSGAGFIPYDIPIPKDISSNNLLQLSPNRTGFFVSVMGHNKTLGDFLVYVHGKFNGSNNTFKLDRAYATIREWTFGYTLSTFVDPIAQPSTVETQGPNSEISDKRMLVRYIKPIDKKWTIAASVEAPNAAIPTSDTYKPHTPNIPDFAAFVQYAYNKQHIRLSAIVRNMGYTNLTDMTNHNVTGWGINLNMKLRPIDPLTLYASFNTGRGIGNTVNDLSAGDNDLIGYVGTGKMYAPRSYGWYGAVQYNFRPNLFSTVIVSQERLLLEHNSDYTPQGYRYGLYGTVNTFWNIVPRLQLGAEFNIGRRMNEDGVHRPGYRASIMAQYSF